MTLTTFAECLAAAMRAYEDPQATPDAHKPPTTTHPSPEPTKDTTK